MIYCYPDILAQLWWQFCPVWWCLFTFPAFILCCVNAFTVIEDNASLGCVQFSILRIVSALFEPCLCGSRLCTFKIKTEFVSKEVYYISILLFDL